MARQGITIQFIVTEFIFGIRRSKNRLAAPDRNRDWSRIETGSVREMLAHGIASSSLVSRFGTFQHVSPRFQRVREFKKSKFKFQKSLK